MNANSLLTQLEGEISAGAFESSFDRPHHIVVRDDFVCAVISHGEHGVRKIIVRTPNFVDALMDQFVSDEPSQFAVKA